jgi:putative toxin-antitoxin system antitoxin component (TIGR02293 family)
VNGRLRAYDGVIESIDVLKGLVVLRTRTAQTHGETRAPEIAKHLSRFDARSRQSTLERILEGAIDVIGTREEAMRWLGTPVRALNYATPVSLLVDDAGADQVLAVRANLENGVL